MSGNHYEVLTFHLIDALQLAVILGFSGLMRQNPHIKLTLWSYFGLELSLSRGASWICPVCYSSWFLCMWVSRSLDMDFKDSLRKLEQTLWHCHNNCGINSCRACLHPRAGLFTVCLLTSSKGEMYRRLPASSYHQAPSPPGASSSKGTNLNRNAMMSNTLVRSQCRNLKFCDRFYQ